MTDIGELTVRIKADAAQLEREMTRANGIVKERAGMMGGALSSLRAGFAGLIPTIAVGAITAYTKHLIDAAGAMQDLADRTGTTIEFLSAMESQAVESGASLGDVAQVIGFMSNTIGEAARGNEQVIESFSRLGIEMEYLKALSPEEQFYLISQRISELGTQFERTEAARNIFGRGVTTLLPIIQQGGEALRGMNEQLREQGHALSTEQVKALDDFGDALARTGHSIEVYLTGAIANALIELRAFFSEAGDLMNNPNVSFNRPASVSQATIGGPNARRSVNESLAKRGLPVLPDPAPRKESTQAAKEHTEATIKEADAIKLCTTAYDELADRMQEADRIQEILNDRLAQGLTNVVFKANSAKDAIAGFADEIARAYFQRKIAQPFADALIGTDGGTGLLDGLIGDVFGGFFAEGGRPPLGKMSVVGENGPEIFVPDQAGTVIPNHMLGGNSVTVQQTIVINPGVPELINQKIREAAPSIANAAVASVAELANRGGAYSKALGRRQ